MTSKLTLGEELRRAAASDRGISILDLAERTERLPYAELYQRALELSGSLQSIGLVPGETVALIFPTGVGFLRAFYGAVLAGLIPVPLYPPIRLGRLDEYQQRTTAMLRACRAAVVLTEGRTRRLLGPSIEGARPRYGCLTLDDLPRASRPTQPVVGDDDLALIQFSSGTIDQPKPVALSHAQVLSNVRAIVDLIVTHYPEQDGLRHAGVSWLPLYHDMGLIGCLLTAVSHSGDLTLIPPELFVARPALWLRAISRSRATVSPAPNFAYALCAQRIDDAELAGVDLSSWRLALNGAEPVTASVLERFIARFAPYGLRQEALTPVYGLAEAALAVTCYPPRERFSTGTFDRERLAGDGVANVVPKHGQTLVNLGVPLPGVQLRIVDDRGRELASDLVGRVQVRSPSVMSGYYCLTDATAAVLVDGWLDTGDMGFLHQGSLFLMGRSKDIVIVRGRNYAPQEIEQAAELGLGVRPGCVAAIGIVSETADGEQLLLLVERAKRTRQTDDQIATDVRRHVTTRTGIAPAQVIVLEPGTLPRTSSGKIRRTEAKRRYLTGTLDPPRTMTPLRLAGALAHSHRAMRRSLRAPTLDETGSS